MRSVFIILEYIQDAIGFTSLPQRSIKSSIVSTIFSERVHYVIFVLKVIAGENIYSGRIAWKLNGTISAQIPSGTL